MLQEEMQKKENRKKAVTGNNVKVKKKSKDIMAGNKAENKKLKSNQ